MAFTGKGARKKPGKEPTSQEKGKGNSSSDEDFEEEDDEDDDELDDLEEESDIVSVGKKRKAPTKSTGKPKSGRKRPSRVVIEEKPKADLPSARTRSTRKSQIDETKMDVDEEESEDTVKPLMGLKIVVSGEFELVSRKKLEEIIETLGGQKMSGVSSRTHYLVVGYKLEDGRAVT